MFLLPSVAGGLVFALVLGGKPSRVLEVPLRLQHLVVVAFGIQLGLFSHFGARLPEQLERGLHLGSYVLLLAFAIANLRLRALWMIVVGLACNAAAIAANGGVMPVSTSAAHALGFSPGDAANVSDRTHRLGLLGDVFALPRQLPLANVFSAGDVLIGFGMVALIVFVSLDGGAERALSVRRMLAPLHSVPYRRLASAKLVSHVGDWLTLAALVGWIYSETGSTSQVAGLMLIRLAPPILGGGVAAVVVDRLPKSHLLFFTELARGAAVAAALGGVLAGSRTAVFAALAISGALAALSAAAVPALLPSLLDGARLPAANAGLGITKDVAMAIGAGLGGLLLALVGASLALALDLVTFAAAAALYAGLPREALPRARSEGESRLSGLAYLLRRPRVLLLMLGFGSATLATGLTQVSLPRFLDAQVGFGAGGYGFGIAAIAIGLAAGETLVGLARIGDNAGRWIGAGLVVMAAFFVVLAFAVHAPTTLLLLGAIGFVDGTTDVLYDTVLQRETDPSRYGCVFGFSSTFMTSTMMSAIVLAPFLNSVFDPRAVILGAGAVLVVAATFALLAMRVGRRALAAPAVPAPA